MLFDFKCPDGHTQESWVPSTTRVITCRECGKESVRQIAAARVHLEAISGHFPGATLKWAKDHENAAKRGRLRER